MLSARIQRIMMGTVLLLTVYLLGVNEIVMASRILTAMVLLVYVWAIFDFCPSLWVLEKICKDGECQINSLKNDN